MFLYGTFIFPVFAEKNILHNHTLFCAISFWQYTYFEQLLSGMKYRKSKISSKISDEHLETSLINSTFASELDWCVSFRKKKKKKKVKYPTSYIFFVPLSLFLLRKIFKIKMFSYLYISNVVSFARAAPKVMCPVLLCRPITSEVDAGGMAVGAEPSHQYCITFCCCVTNGSRGAV